MRGRLWISSNRKRTAIGKGHEEIAFVGHDCFVLGCDASEGNLTHALHSAIVLIAVIG